MSISPMRKKTDLIFFVNEPEPIFENFTETSPVVPQKNSMSSLVFFNILLLFPLWKGRDYYFYFYFLISMISLFCYFLLCKRASSFIWTNYNPPLPRDALRHVWLKLAWWFWRTWRYGNLTRTITTMTTYIGQSWPENLLA